MHGTDASVVTDALIRRLVAIGWLFAGAEIGFLLFQAERVRTVDGTRFSTAWDQRVEVMSFLLLPPNLVTLVPAAGMAVLAAVLVGAAPRSAWLDALLRLVAAIAITLVFVGVASIAEILSRVGQNDELDAVFLRLGGMSLAVGIALSCRFADRIGRTD